MNKSVLLAAAAVLALSAGGASAASHPSMAQHSVKAHSINRNAVNRSLSTLYDQSANDSGIGIVSQNFESSFDVYDAQAADDFTVPSGSTWKISEIDVNGVYFNGSGPAVSETVTFYKDKKGHPGKIKKTFTATGSDSFGSFVITAPGKGVKLKHGTYWMSVQVNMDFGAGGEWGWENQSTAEGTAAKWKNAGDGFATGCVTYTQENTCIPDGQGDHMFVLKGKSK